MCSRTTCACPPASPTCWKTARLMKRLFPELFKSSDILPVDDYPTQLYDTLAALSPRAGDRPAIVVLTPGIYNSAYFEHSYLAQKMGAILVEGSDLVVPADDCVYMKTISGLRACRCDLPPHRRRLPRSRSLPARFGAGRARPDARLARRQGRHRQCAGRGRGRRQGGLYLRAADHQVLPRPGPDPAQRAELAVHGSPSSASMCSPTWTSWWSSRPTNPAATAC